MESVLPASPGSTSEVPNLRKRGRTACTRCKTRKQKCDDQLPVCSNCQRAGAECDKADITDETPPAAYTRALEDRVAFLEKKLDQLQQRHVAEPEGGPGCSPANTTIGRDGSALNDIVTLIAVGEAEGANVSTGPSLSMILNEMVQATVWHKSLPDAASPSNTTAHKAPDAAKRISIEELIAKSAKEPPSDELGSRIIRAYFQQLHPRYPFLDPEEVWELHSRRQSLTSDAHRDTSAEQRFGIFKLYLVYAMGATLLQLTEKLTFSPEGFYMTALQHTSAARESRSIQNIEAMTLLVVYHLRSASSHGIWYMIGLAMRTCIDLGMHRKIHDQNLTPEQADRRRRLFWTVYSLERTIAISLGRPLSIPDRQIDVPFPELGHPATSPSATPGSAVAPSPVQPTPKASTMLALHLFRLRRVEGRIYHAVYRADRPLTSLLPKLDTLFASLSAWRDSLLASVPASSPELNYPLLHYNRALRLLIQPFLPILPLTSPFHALCLRAAGDICQAHKRLHQSLDYGHSFIAVQTVFVAGLTLLHGLWRWTDKVWTVALADDIRACSLVLFVMGERAAWVRRYRDAFEMLVNAAMDKLRGVESSLSLARQNTAEHSPGAGPPRKRARREKVSGLMDAGINGRSGLSASHPSPQELGAASFHEHWAGRASGDASAYRGGGIAAGEGSDPWPIVMELANWIEQDGGSPVWMPDFEMLQNLHGA